MKKRLAKVILWVIGGPIALYWIGFVTNIFIPGITGNPKTDPLINDGSVAYYLTVMFACGLIGIILLGLIFAVCCLLRVIFLTFKAYITTGNWSKWDW